MINPVQEAKTQLLNIVLNAYEKAVQKGLLKKADLNDTTAEIPKDTKNGDYAVNFALVNAKVLGLPPRKIAEIISDNLTLSDTFFGRAEIAGPGFINFFLNDSYYKEVLYSAAQKGNSYGKSDFGEGKKVMIEFVSANPTGPMHLGNARGGAIGDTLASVMQWAGFNVTREFYINDCGNQIERLLASLKARYIQYFKGDAAAELPEDGYQGEDIKARAAEFAVEFGDKYLDADEETLRNTLVKYTIDKNLKDIEETLRRYRIEYDVWFRESSLYEQGEIESTLKEMEARGFIYTGDDGAVWLYGEKLGLEQDIVLVRSNGLPTYITPDIAYHKNKFLTRGFDRVIDVLGADHHGHILRMKAVMPSIGIGEGRFHVVTLQLVRLMSEGEVVRMSKRTGKAISLTDLLDEVNIDAVRFFFNMRTPESQMDFDLDLAKKQDSDNPVYYVQYAHARICSMLNLLESEGAKLWNTESINTSLLTCTEETELIKLISRLPDEIKLSARDLDPSKMTQYAISLAGAFHKFYTACRIKGEAENLMQARMLLSLCVKNCLENVLGILKVTAPEKM